MCSNMPITSTKTDNRMLVDAWPLRGEKVEIYPFRIEDITDSYLGWLNDPEVLQYSNQRFHVHDRDSCTRYLASFEKSHNLFLSVRRRDNGCAIGTMTVYFSPHHGTADVGIMIGERAVWGKGYGQDAWNTVIEWLLSHEAIRKVTAGTLACNYGMLKLMERSGMTLEAVRNKQELVAGEPIDILYYLKWHETKS